MDLLREIGIFLVAVINNWAGYCTGGVIVALLGLWSTLRQKSIPRGIGVVVAIFFLAAATFNAWRDQYHAVSVERNAQQTAKNNNQPNLEAKINAVMVGQHGHGHTLLAVSATVVNHGAPSIAYLEGVSVILRNGRTATAQPLIPTGKDEIVPGGKGVPTVVMPASGYFPQKAMNNPIPQGGAVVGWAMFVVIDASEEEVSSEGTQIIWKCADVNGKHITATITEHPGLDFGSAFNPTLR